jgi:hypothetical protein
MTLLVKCLKIIIVSGEKKERHAVSQRAFHIVQDNNYGKATYRLELQVRHQKLLTMFILITFAKMSNRNQKCKKK